MTEKQTFQLIRWLNDLCATEIMLSNALATHVVGVRNNHPELAEKFAEHILVMQHNQKLLEAEIKRLGGSVSTIKHAIASITGQVHAMSTWPFWDEALKDIVVEYGASQGKVLAYTALRSIAGLYGEPAIVSLSALAIEREEMMISYLERSLPSMAKDLFEESV